MLTIRFLRQGKKHQPFFKIVVTDKRRSPKSGKFIEEVGFYNPITKEKGFKRERIKYWLSQGVDTSDSVHNLLVKEGIIQGKKIPVHSTKKKKEEKAQIEEKKKLQEETSKEDSGEEKKA
jgi:small subunit ribosomal protein S16